MQFIASSIEAMKADPPRKTKTRRLQNEGERLVYGHYTWDFFNKYGRSLGIARQWGWRDRPDEIFRVATILDKHGRIKWQEGRRYASQRGRGKFGIGSYLCTSLRSQRLHDITEYDAIDEGIYETPIADLRLYKSWGFWNGVDGIPYATALLAYECLWEIINDKPRIRWADNPKVWDIGMGEFEWKEE